MNEDELDDYSNIIFKNIKQKNIDNFNQYLIDQCADSTVEVYIGTDSKVTSMGVTYVCAICFYRKEQGGHIIYAKKTYRNKKISLDTRLWREVEISKYIAEMVKIVLPSRNKIFIDLDLNPNKIYDSNRLYAPAIGYLSSLGFSVRGKGELIPAIYAANFLCQK